MVSSTMHLDACNTFRALIPFAFALPGLEIEAIGTGYRFEFLVVKMNAVHAG